MGEKRDKDVKRKATKKEHFSEKQKKKPLGAKVIAACVLLLILLMAVSAVLATVFDIPLFNLGNKTADGKLIYSMASEHINDIYEYSSGVVVLTDTSVEYIDSTGKKISSNSHLFAQPVMKSNGDTVIVYDKGGTTFRIERNSSVYNTYTVNSPITMAVVGKKNNYAYVLNNDAGYQSHLYVYSYQGKKQFEWGSAADYCISAALSDNGKSIAVATIGVENGEYISKVNYFNFKEDEAEYTAVFHDSTVFHLQFKDNKTVVALTDNGIFVINKDGTTEKIAEYSPSEITHSASFNSGLNAYSIAYHGNFKDSQVTVFNKKFEKLYDLKYSGEIFNICTSKDFVAVLMNGNIYVYNKDGKITGSVIITEKCLDAVFSGRTLFVQTVSGIYSFDAYSDTDITVTNETTSTQTENIENNDVQIN